MPPPNSQRPSRSAQKLDEYQRFQAGQAAQQAQMMQMLQQMYGINERQQLLPGQLQQQQDQSAVAQNALDVSRQMTPAQLAAIQADTQYRQGLTSMQPDQQRGLQLQNEGQSQQNIWAPIMNTSELAQRGAQTANLAASAEGHVIQNANAPAHNALVNQGLGAQIAQTNAGTAGQLIENDFIAPLAKQRLSLGDATMMYGLHDRGAANTKELQQFGGPPEFWQQKSGEYGAVDTAREAAAAAETAREIAALRGRNPQDQTYGAALGAGVGDAIGASYRYGFAPLTYFPRQLGAAVRTKTNKPIPKVPFTPPKGNFWDYQPQ